MKSSPPKPPARVSHIRFLLRLAEFELIDRERRMVERRIRAAQTHEHGSTIVTSNLPYEEWTLK
jgi:hypothetical protein